MDTHVQDGAFATRAESAELIRPELFERFAGRAAIGLAGGGIAYSIVFLVYLHNGSRGTKIADSVFLLLSGLVVSLVLVALYQRLKRIDASFALWATVIGVGGAIASSLHGGYDLGVAIKHLNAPELSQVDPRGLATFGLTAVGVATLSWLMTHDRTFPRGLGYMGVAAGLGLLLTYVGRISLYNPHRSVLLALLVLVGFVLTPGWYAWLGLSLARAKQLPRHASNGSRARADEAHVG